MCTTCGTFIYRGTKFNSKKETVLDEEYCGVRIFRLYMRCPTCSAEFTLKTDPKNSDYIAELGCTRNFEPWRDKEATVEEAKKKREEEEKGDAMKALENRTMDSKVEMDIIDALEEIKTLNARNAKISPDQLINMFGTQKRKREELTEEDEKELKNVVFKNGAAAIESKKPKTEEKGEILPPVVTQKPKKPPMSSIKFTPKVTPKPKSSQFPNKEKSE